MAIKVYLFGKLKELAGHSEVLLEGISDTDQLTTAINNKFPKTKGIPCLIAVDRHIIHSNTLVKEGQELALMPPYSGG
jgi:sulfur-carrier protein